MKKTYSKPALEVMDVHAETGLLQSSIPHVNINGTGGGTLDGGDALTREEHTFFQYKPGW